MLFLTYRITAGVTLKLNHQRHQREVQWNFTCGTTMRSKPQTVRNQSGVNQNNQRYLDSDRLKPSLCSNMVSMKGQLLAIIAVISVSVIFSSVSFYSSAFSNGGEYAMSAADRVTSLSSQESYGWFTDIPDEGWELMKLRARKAVQYTNPWKPDTGHENPIMWYLNNLQVSRL